MDNGKQERLAFEIPNGPPADFEKLCENRRRNMGSLQDAENGRDLVEVVDDEPKEVL